MSIIIALLIFAVTSEAKLFLIEVKEKTSTNDSVLNSMNKGLSMLPKCSKEWVKAPGQISGWNTKPNICGDKECIKNAEELHQVCKEQMLDGNGQNMIHISLGSYPSQKKHAPDFPNFIWTISWPYQDNKNVIFRSLNYHYAD